MRPLIKFSFLLVLPMTQKDLEMIDFLPLMLQGEQITRCQWCLTGAQIF